LRNGFSGIAGRFGEFSYGNKGNLTLSQGSDWLAKGIKRPFRLAGFYTCVRSGMWSPSNLSREKLLVGGIQAFGATQIDAEAKKGAPFTACPFSCTNYGLSLITRRTRHKCSLENTKVEVARRKAMNVDQS
jgi:hypothetical protein